MSEKLYLCCRVCGEVFDEIETANNHGEDSEDYCPKDEGYDIVPESEAF